MTGLMSKIHVKEMSKKSICDGFLYYVSGSKKILLLKPGSLISQSFLHKHAMAGTTFEITHISDENLIKHFSGLFKELKYLHFEKDLQAKAEEIVEQFFEAFSQNKHFFSFAFACYEEFCAQKEMQSVRLNETDVNLFIKSFYSASLSILFALSNGIFHYPMVKDIYNLSFCLDIGLCHKNYSFYVSQACNVENKSPGTGLTWMKNHSASLEEVEVFFNHPNNTFKFFQENSILNFPELAQTVLYQHELANGEGFPKGVNHSQISGVESILILADAMVEIKDEDHFEKGILDHFEHFESKKLMILPVKRVLNQLMKKRKNYHKLEGTGT